MAGASGTPSGPRRVAVIDIGKTNAKLVLVDRSAGREIDSLTTANAARPGPLYPHHDVEALWAFILDGLARLHARHRVEAVSITTHGATAALMAGAELALPVLDYEHDGPAQTAAEYTAARPPFAESLSPRLPDGLNLGAQIFWQANRFAEAFARADAILMYPQYWGFRLTGRKVSEVTSLGCHTDLWAPDRRDFSSLVDRRGWRDLFPPLAAADSVIGPVRPEIAAATGLDPETPVACGIHDSNASLLPYLGALEPPFNIVSSGTWTIVMHVGGPTDGLDETRDSLANVDLTGRPVPTARFMGGRDYRLLAGDDAPPPTVDDAPAAIGKGIMALPGFVPGVGPFPNAQGRWLGDPATLAPGERAAAASLYLALVTAVCLEISGTGHRIVVEGPLAGNPVYVSALASLTGVPVTASEDTTGTSLGAAMLVDGGNAAMSAVDPVDVGFEDAMLSGLDAYAARWRREVGA